MKSRNKIKLGQIEEFLDGLQDKIGFARYRMTDQIYSSGVLFAVQLDGEMFNEDLPITRFDNNTKIKVDVSGYYELSAILSVGIVTNSYANFLAILKNSDSNLTQSIANSQSQGEGGGTTISTGVVYLENGDYISLVAEIGSGIRHKVEISIKKL